MFYSANNLEKLAQQNDKVREFQTHNKIARKTVKDMKDHESSSLSLCVGTTKI